MVSFGKNTSEYQNPTRSDGVVESKPSSPNVVAHLLFKHERKLCWPVVPITLIIILTLLAFSYIHPHSSVPAPAGKITKVFEALYNLTRVIPGRKWVQQTRSDVINPLKDNGTNTPVNSTTFQEALSAPVAA